ncbi:MAG: tRNA adenosine(34) deaminase TadA [Paraperlucidibaca sp.]
MENLTHCTPTAHALDEYFMRLALAQAALAAESGEVPVGAVLVASSVNSVSDPLAVDFDATQYILAQAHNAPIKNHDPTAHAEIQVIRRAAAKLQNYRLDGSTLYVTLEPCTMCVGALVHARVQRVVFAASEPKSGALHSARALMSDDSGYFNHRFMWQAGVLAEEAAEQLKRFFQQRRLLKR